MLSLQEQTQVLYEIAINIGGSMELQEMLKQSMQIILRKLNGLGGVVLADRRDGERRWLEEVFAMPRNIHRSPAYAQAIEDLPTGDAPGTGRTHWPKPRARPTGDVYHYRFDLAGFGLLVLLKARPLEPTFARSLRPICDKLAEACIACETAAALAESRENLRESEMRYRELADSIADVFFAMDENLRYTYWNKASEKLTGIPAQDAIGKSIHDLFSGASHARRAEEIYREVLRTQQPHTFRNEYPVGDETLQLEISAYPSKDGLSVFVKDITARVRAVEALRESEQTLRLFLENFVGIAYQSSHLTFRPSFFYGAVEEITGYTSDDFTTGRVAWGELIHPDDMEMVSKLGERVRDTPGYVADSEYRIRTRDGQVRWVRDIGKAIRLEDGQTYLVQGAIYDVTKRVRAEADIAHASEALQKSEERYRRLVENMDDLVYRYEFTPQRGFTYVSPSAVEITGYTPEEHYADPDLGVKLVHPEDRHLLERMTQGEEIGNSITLRFVRKDGSLLWVEQRNVLIHDDEGNPVAMEGVARDITERKQAEDALREYQEHLEDLIAERTAELRKLVNAMAGREVRMAELKGVIRKLRAQLKGAGLTPVADDPLLGSGEP